MIVNLTPHAIHLADRVIEPSGTIARCSEVVTPAGEWDGVPLVNIEYGEVTGYPDEGHPDILYIVSKMVRDAMPTVPNCASPGELVRDDKGVILYAKNLAINGKLIGR